MLGMGGVVTAIGVLWRAYRGALKDSRQRELDLLRKGSEEKRSYMARLEEHGQLMGSVQRGVRSQRDVMKCGFRALNERLVAIESAITGWRR